LTLWGNIWRAKRNAPSPVLVWNHSTLGPEPELLENTTGLTSPLDVWLSNGLSVFAPTRRGYDGAEGEPLPEVLNSAPNGSSELQEGLIKRLVGEKEDLLAGVEFLKAQDWVNPNLIFSAGYGFGAIVTLLAMAESKDLRGGIGFSIAGLLWDDYPKIQALLMDKAAKIKNPLLLLNSADGYNDEPAKKLVQKLRKGSAKSNSIVYPSRGLSRAEGHDFFAYSHQWVHDAEQFLSVPNALLSTSVVVSRGSGSACCR